MRTGNRKKRLGKFPYAAAAIGQKRWNFTYEKVCARSMQCDGLSLSLVTLLLLFVTWPGTIWWAFSLFLFLFVFNHNFESSAYFLSFVRSFVSVQWNNSMDTEKFKIIRTKKKREPCGCAAAAVSCVQTHLFFPVLFYFFWLLLFVLLFKDCVGRRRRSSRDHSERLSAKMITCCAAVAQLK